MAVEAKKKQRQPLASGGGGGVKRFFRLMLGCVAAVLCVLMLFGFINQVRTGETIVEFISNTGGKVGKFFTYALAGDERSPVEVTGDGVYAKGHTPQDKSGNEDAIDIAKSLHEKSKEGVKEGFDSV